MTGSYVLQPQTRVAGQGGHVTDHDNLGAVLAGNSGIVFNVLNTSFSGGADPTGTSDCTAVFQACLDAIVAFGFSGNVMYIPAGNYLQNGEVSWDAGVSLAIIGDGMGVTRILMNTSTPAATTYWTITNTVVNANRLTIQGITWANNVNASLFSSENVVMRLNTIGWATFRNVAMGQTAGATNRVNTCVVINDGGSVDFDQCDFRSYVNGVVMQGVAAAVTFRNGSFGQNEGTGIATAANILMTGDPATLHVFGVYFNSGDRGLLMTGGTGPNPAFVVMYDAEFNNMIKTTIELDTGAECWFTACYIASASGQYGVFVGSAFQGTVYFSQCVIQGFTSHNVVLGGGSGYDFEGCTFGSNNKASSNTADMINIQSGVSYVTVQNCHFNVDPYYGLGGPNKPRSAVYVNSGATNIRVNGCMSPPDSSYGTRAGVYPSGCNAVQAVNMPSTYE